MATRIRQRKNSRRQSFKQAQFIRVHNYLLALGLEWHEAKDGNVRYLRQLAKNSRGAYGTLLVSEEGDASALFGMVANANSGRRARSAAACVARMYEQVIVVFPVGNNIYWLCAVVGGMVLTGKDVVAPEEQIREMTRELLVLNPDFECVGDQDFWSALDIEKSVQAMSVEAFFDVEICEAIPPLEHYGSRRWLWITATVIACCLVGIAGHMSYRDWQSQRMNELAEATPDPAEIAIKAHNDNLLNVVQSQGLHHANPQWVRQILSLLDRTPTQINGWRLVKVDCDFLSDHCIQHWDSIVGTYIDFLRAKTSRGKEANIAFVSPNKIEQTIVLNKKDNMLGVFLQEQYLREYLTRLPKQREFQVHDVSTLQSLGILDTVEFGVNSVPKSYYPAPSATEKKTPLGDLAVGEWHVGGQNLVILLGAIQLLNPTVFHVQSLILTLNTKEKSPVQWSLKGRYTTQGGS